MTILNQAGAGQTHLVMGNEAIVRGALEAGVRVAAGYPGTPSSEIIENLARVSTDEGLYVEWSINEKVALEVAAAGSFAGLRSLCAMKQNGVNVASDFLLHLAASGTRAGLVLVPCDDPGALSSINEGESRHFARLVEIPLLEPGDFQEAKDLIPWAFELSERLRTVVMVRSVTRLSHASGSVTFGELPTTHPKPVFRHQGFILDQMEGVLMSAPVDYKHAQQQQRLRLAAEIFETCPFNTYEGPVSPELLVVTSSACALYSREAIRWLGLEGRVGLLKLATTYPLPERLLEKHLSACARVLVVEEVIPFLEDNLKVLACELVGRIGPKTFHGKKDGRLPTVGELNPDLVSAALAGILGREVPERPPDYTARAQALPLQALPGRELTFCPGCPHRASFFALHNALTLDARAGFVCGDIGCYSMAVLPCGFSTLKTMHSMGSGTGLASGFGALKARGLDQSVVAVCGDSTFFHSGLPALINAVHHSSDLTLVVLDNRGTAMTGFQPHPGLAGEMGTQKLAPVDIPELCRAIGARVEVADPFELAATEATLLELLDQEGVKVLVLRQICALSPEKKAHKAFEMSLDQEVCLGENCGCNRLCTRVFRCPGLIWDAKRGAAVIDEVICTGCGVCAAICPSGAITKKEARHAS